MLCRTGAAKRLPPLTGAHCWLDGLLKKTVAHIGDRMFWQRTNTIVLSSFHSVLQAYKKSVVINNIVSTGTCFRGH